MDIENGLEEKIYDLHELLMDSLLETETLGDIILTSNNFWLNVPELEEEEEIGEKEKKLLTS